MLSAFYQLRRLELDLELPSIEKISCFFRFLPGQPRVVLCCYRPTLCLQFRPCCTRGACRLCSSVLAGSRPVAVRADAVIDAKNQSSDPAGLAVALNPELFRECSDPMQVVQCLSFCKIRTACSSNPTHLRSVRARRST